MSRLTNYFSVTPVDPNATQIPNSEHLLNSEGFKPGVYNVPVKKSAIGMCVFNNTHQHLRIDILDSSIPSDIILNMSSMWEIYSKIINQCENSFFIHNLSKIFQVKLFDEVSENSDFKIVNGISGEAIHPRQYLVLTVNTSNDSNKLFGLFILSQLNSFKFNIVCNGEAFTLMENSLAQNFEVPPTDAPNTENNNIDSEWQDPDTDNNFLDLMGDNERNDVDDITISDQFNNYNPDNIDSDDDIDSIGNSSDSDSQIIMPDETSPHSKYLPKTCYPSSRRNIDSVSEASTTNSLNKTFKKMKVQNTDRVS